MKCGATHCSTAIIPDTVYLKQEYDHTTLMTADGRPTDSAGTTSIGTGVHYIGSVHCATKDVTKCEFERL